MAKSKCREKERERRGKGEAAATVEKKVIDLWQNYGKLLLFLNLTKRGETTRDEANFSNFNVEISNFRVQHTHTHKKMCKERAERKSEKKKIEK